MTPNPYQSVPDPEPNSPPLHPTLLTQIVSAMQFTTGIGLFCIAELAGKASMLDWLDGSIIRLAMWSVICVGFLLTLFSTVMRSDWTLFERILYLGSEALLCAVLAWILLILPL